MEIDVVIQGDCLDVMAGMEDECVDLVVTDPPYGISFMGKAWDKALPSVDVWRECLRVLKPGAFAFVMCIPRQDCLSRMIINLEDAGFMVNFSPMLHTFATGFPKAMSISKAIDKRAGVEREVIGRYKPPSDNPKNNWSSENSMYDRPPITGSPFEDKWPAGNITAPATPEAKALDGAYAGFQPKPCYEVIICVMKPCTEKTYLDQALANVHGCTWLDDGRIPYEGQIDYNEASRESRGANDEKPFRGGKGGYRSTSQQGRFAPNLLCSDDVLNDGVERKSNAGNSIRRQVSHFGGNGESNGIRIGDSGSFSRYFSLDKWVEKNLPESVNRTFPFMIVPKASKSEKNAGLDELEDKEMWNGHANQINGSGQSAKQIMSKNHHPTVKPIKLMSYLIAIGSCPGDAVLDPYAGSGTTGIAAALLDRRYILIELETENVDIAERRIAWHVEQMVEEEQAQLKLDFAK